MVSHEGTGDRHQTPETPWIPPPRPEGYDELGAEMAPGARVWKKYVDETDKADKELVEGWNKTLDVILVFVRLTSKSYEPNLTHHVGCIQAALFSAISTAFVLESSKDLKPDYTHTSAQTLFLISQSLSAIASGSRIDSPAPLAPDPDIFAPSSSAIAVNILWFLSLSLSVAVSLVAILAKDWCSFFMSGRVGPMLKQGRMRQQRWDGVEWWKMKGIMDVLPLLMHIALLLFAIGLSVYLWDINVRVALPVVITTSLAALFYMITVSLPLVSGFCPYRTALARFLFPHWLDFISHAYTRGCIGVICASGAWVLYWMAPSNRMVRKRGRSPTNQTIVVGDIEASTGPAGVDPVFSFRRKRQATYKAVQQWVDSMRGMFSTDRSEMDESNTPMDKVTSSMLSWMITRCEDPKAVNIALQALAGADRALPFLPLQESNATQLVCQRIKACATLLRSSAGGLQSTHGFLLDDASLFYRSHTFLCKFARGERVETQDFAVAAEFTWNIHHGPINGRRDEQENEHATMQLEIDFVLNCLWTGPFPRYDLAEYEFNNNLGQDEHWTWRKIEEDQKICKEQWELLKQYVSADPEPVQPLLIDWITRTFLYNPLQSPVLLVHLLRPRKQSRVNQPSLRRDISIALAVAAFSTGSFATESRKIDAKSHIDWCQLRRANQVYIELSRKKFESDKDLDRLTFFGLICLLGHTIGSGESLNSNDIKAIQACLSPLQLDSNFTYHNLVSLIPDFFGPFHHISQVISSLFSTTIPQAGQSVHLKAELESRGNLLLRIETILSHPLCLCPQYAGELLPLLTQDLVYSDPARLYQLRFKGVDNLMLAVGQDKKVLSDLWEFFIKIVELTTLTTEHAVPFGMRFLWDAGGKLLEPEHDIRTPGPRSATIIKLLPTLYTPFTIRTTESGLPANLNELGLADEWLPRIVDLCSDDPASLLDSNLIATMIEFYQVDMQRSTRPRAAELPEKFDPHVTWLEILRDLEQGCKAAVEQQAKPSAIVNRDIKGSLPVREENEGEGEGYRDTKPFSHLRDGSI